MPVGKESRNASKEIRAPVSAQTLLYRSVLVMVPSSTDSHKAMESARRRATGHTGHAGHVVTAAVAVLRRDRKGMRDAWLDVSVRDSKVFSEIDSQRG